ncbi:MAG: hypothetical protein LBE47_01575 [Methanomassiliicoccaceae archaeon]|jgi:Co/Zn/Cd efflux system component|nr:hypothetical protein [Methanomassiliicoccaceae archaeon]
MDEDKNRKIVVVCILLFLVFVFIGFVGGVLGEPSLIIISFAAAFVSFFVAFGVGLLRQMKTGSGGDSQKTKTCGACGHIMKVTDHSCPNCFTLRPDDRVRR